MPLTAVEREIATAIGFDEDVCELIKARSGRTFSRLSGYTEQFKRTFVRGLSVAVPKRDVQAILSDVRPELRSRGFLAFCSDIHSARGTKESDEIAVLKTDDEYAIVSIKCTNGANYDVSTTDVLDRLKSWERRCQFEVVGAAESWVAISFQSLPDDICEFAEEVYDFCPDTVDQGVGLTREQDEPETFEAARQLCPILSPEMERKLKVERERFEQLPIPKELRESLQSNSTPTEMGVRLLAYYIHKSKQLFLWWD